jgi:hypothetical protein
VLAAGGSRPYGRPPEGAAVKLVLLVLLVLLVVAVVTASRRRGPAVGSPQARRAKAATDQAIISRQGHNQGFSGGSGS